MRTHSRSQPRPGPTCGSVAPLVALVVGQQRLNPKDAQTLRMHLKTCDSCRSTLDSYRRLDDAPARQFAPSANHPLSPAEMSASSSQRHQPGSRGPVHQTRPTTIRGSRPLPPPQGPHQRRRQRFFATLGALAAVMLIAAVGLALFISHAHSPGASKPGSTTSASVTPPATLPPVSEVPYTPGPKDILSGISMVSDTDGWAVGSSFVGPGLRDTIILHYTGGQWMQVIGVPDNAQIHASSTALSQVVMVSATEGWAIGNAERASTQEPFGLLLHYTGGRWTVQQDIAHGYLSSLAMSSASNGWAVGGTLATVQSFPNQSLLLHYDGRAWASEQAPGQMLLGVAMTSATDGWIIGSTNGTSQLGDMLFRYNGSAWSQAALPPSLRTINHLSPVASNDVWAVGFGGASGGARSTQARTAGGGQIVFTHYDGQTWTTAQVSSLAGQTATISSLFMDGSNDGWAVGWVANPTSGGVGGTKMLYLHYTGGKWTEVPGPDEDGQAVLSMHSASEGWAVGGDNATILHYHNGVWSVVLGA